MATNHSLIRVNQVSLRWYIVAGHLLFLGLFILSVLHFRERVIYADSAFQIFKWIQLQGLQFEAYRYTAVVPQLVVKLLKHSGADLKLLLEAASATHILVAWAIFSICAHVVKQHWIAVASVLAAVLCTRVSFYGAVLEIHYLLSYPFLFMAFLMIQVENQKSKIEIQFLVMIALSLVLLVHPLGFLVAIYVCGFVWLISKKNRNITAWVAGIALIWGLFGRALFPPTEYEQGLYDAVIEGVKWIPQISELPSFRLLIDHTWKLTPQFLFAWIALVVAIALAVKRKAYILAAYVFTSCVGFLLLTIVTYYKGESAVMLEKSFLPLSTLIAIPFLYEVVALNTRWRKILIVPFVMVLFFQFRAISFASRAMTERYSALTKIVDEARDKQIEKGVKDAVQLDSMGVDVQWALPYETILASSLIHRDSTVAVISSVHFDAIEGNQLHPWYMINDQKTNYFRIPEGVYEKME